MGIGQHILYTLTRLKHPPSNTPLSCCPTQHTAEAWAGGEEAPADKHFSVTTIVCALVHVAQSGGHAQLLLGSLPSLLGLVLSLEKRE